MGEYSSKLKSEELDCFFEAILSLETQEDCYRFFEDVSTINEIKSLAQRFLVAKMLSEKKTYIEIAEITGASTATISRVNRALNYGSDGYQKALKKLEEKNKDFISK